MSEIKVFGHQSPDTDATMSAIVWAWFLNTHRNQSAVAYVLGMPNTEALFVLKRWEVALPALLESVSSDDVVSVVDTNNADELFPNINDCDIVSIIDHHKLTGGLKTSSPREVVIQPYASTMTVMYNVMNIEPADFPKEIAGLMLSGIISDTLEFRSPTTTDADKKLAHELADALGVSIPEYAAEMFEAKSDISDFSDKELVRLDSKIFDIKDKKVRISVIETTAPQKVLDRREGIVAELEAVRVEDGVDMVLFFVVDILQENALLFVHSDEVATLAQKQFEGIIEDGLMKLPGVVSRKKQVIPMLSK